VVGRGPANDTRERIKGVALQLFHDQGCEKTSLREIAELLGVTKAALYYHFRTKDDLIGDLAAPYVDGFTALLAEAGAREADPTRYLVEGYLDLLLAQRPMIRWLRTDLSARAHPSIGPRLLELGERLNLMLGGRDMSFDEQVRVTAALGALGAAVSQFPDAESGALRDPLLQIAYTILPPS
jgi:AcrR family transcriptional regulator